MCHVTCLTREWSMFTAHRRRWSGSCARCRGHRNFLVVAKEVNESLVASDSFTSDHRRFLARMVVTAEPPEVTTCLTPAYLLPATDSPPRQPPHFRANFCQFHRRYAGLPPNYALCDQGIKDIVVSNGCCFVGGNISSGKMYDGLLDCQVLF